MSYRWFTKEEVIALHENAIADFGGDTGLLDEGALESTLYRPQHLLFYEPGSNIFDLAAAYGYGLAKNHCFVDGNKRTAFIVMAVFFLNNGCELMASEVEVVEIMVDLVNDDISQEELAVWLYENTESI